MSRSARQASRWGQRASGRPVPCQRSQWGCQRDKNGRMYPSKARTIRSSADGAPSAEPTLTSAGPAALSSPRASSKVLYRLSMAGLSSPRCSPLGRSSDWFDTRVSSST